MALIKAYQNRGQTLNMTINDADDNAITPAAGDTVRVRIGREGQTPVLTFDSSSPTANGSSVTKGATNVVRLDTSDLDFDPGIYTLSLELLDASDANEIKMVEKQVFSLEGVI